MIETEKQESIYLDICFVIDTTGSMSYYINEAKNSIQEIINSTESSLREIYPDIYNDILKFSVIAYRDHPPQDNTYITKELDFTSSQEAKKFVEKLSANGGGDFPEAVMDGLYSAANKIKWREKSDKMLFLILDAPGHGKRFGTDNDCPCGYTEKDFMPFFAKNEVKFNLIKSDENKMVQKMIKLFEEYLPIETKVFQQQQNELITSSKHYDSCFMKKKKCESFPKSLDIPTSSCFKKESIPIDFENEEEELEKSSSPIKSVLCENKKSEMVEFVSSKVKSKYLKK